MKFEFSGPPPLLKIAIVFHESPSSGSWVVSCGRTDRQTDRHTYIHTYIYVTKLIVAFHSFANAPEWRSFDYHRCTHFTKNCRIIQIELRFFFLDEVIPLEKCCKFEDYVTKRVTFRMYKFMKTSCRYKNHKKSRSSELSCILKCVNACMLYLAFVKLLWHLWLQGSVNKGYGPNMHRDP